MPIYLDLFLTFFRIGILTFGGGYAMLPMLQREIVQKKGWAKENDLLDYFAVGQCTPGIIAVNTATFIGFKQKKISGAIVSTLGLVTPSLIIITVIAAILRNFTDIPAVKNAFAGIRVAVCVLILNAVVTLLKKAVVDRPTAILFGAVALLAIVFSGVSPIIFILVAGVIGVILRVWLHTGEEVSS